MKPLEPKCVAVGGLERAVRGWGGAAGKGSLRLQSPEDQGHCTLSQDKRRARA